MDTATTPTSDTPHRRFRIALWVSLALHLVALIVFAVWYVGRSQDDTPTAEAPATTVAPVPRPQVPTPPEKPRPSPKVKSTQVETQLDAELRAAEKLEDEQKLTSLKKNIDKLDDLASQESIEELSGKFQQWLQTETRAQQPAANPVPGPFDIDTAQFHDILRQQAPGGESRYVAVLLDAEGRVMEVEIDPETGAQAYRTLQLVKENPLAEMIYRQITMPLMDKMIRARRQLEQAAEKAKDAQTDVSGQSGDPP